MEQRQVVIAGGGITALATGYYLLQQGFEDFVILERHLDPGGLCRSVSKNGFIFDYTGHVLWRMDQETRKFYEDLLGDNLEWTERKAEIATKGVRVPYPFQVHLKNLPPQTAYECLSGFLDRARYLKGTDFESWSLSMFGQGIHEHFMRPFNEKLFGVPMREMTADWCQDVPVPSVDQVLRGAILGETFQMKGNAKFGYPKKGGMQALVDALLAKVGHKVMTGRTVSKVGLETRVVEHIDMAGNRNSIKYGKLISTIPLTKLLKIVVPQDGSLRDFSNKLRANNVACVMLGFERHLTDRHWIYTPDREVPFYRLTIPSSFCRGVTPSPENGMVMAEITIPEDMNASVGDFVGSTLAGLRHLGLWEDDRQNPVHAMHVEFVAPAYVIFDLVRRSVPRFVEGFNSMGVFPAGRFGKWDYTSVSENIADARSVAKEVLK